jgi:hypothetical protein
LIFAPRDQFLFPGANIFVAAIVLQCSSSCRECDDEGALGDLPEFQSVDINGDNWLASVARRRKVCDTTKSRSRESPATGTESRLSDRFEVIASMTTGMAYELIPFVAEDDMPTRNGASDGGMRLVTTGLIEPGECHWGKRPCRYLGNRYDRPIVDLSRDLPRSLRARIDKVRRPKLLVAGLCVRIEAFLDSEGDYCGAVSTWTILHPEDDVAALRELCDSLNGDDASAELERQLGATALGGGRITVTKKFLRNLVLA